MTPYSTRPGPKVKPAKPRPDFPLYPHAVGKWAKTIRRKTYYFGTWADPEGALQGYLDVRDELLAGRPPKENHGLSIRELCNAVLRACRSKVEARETVERTWRDYKQTTDRIVRVFGRQKLVEHLRPADFARLRADIAGSYGLQAFSNQITRTRTGFHCARKNLLIVNDPAFGDSFRARWSPVRKQLFP